MSERESVYVDLLRHGAVEGGSRYRGATDDRLTPAGWEQMWAATDIDAPWAYVVTSPLARCAEFARAFAQRRALPLRVDERLRELHFGDWESLAAEDIMRGWPEAFARFHEDPWSNGPPQGESIGGFEARVRAAWNDIVARGEPALVVTHGGPVRLILCLTRGLPRRELLRLHVPPGSRHRVLAVAGELSEKPR